MDISNVKPASEIIVDILHPATDEPLGIKVAVCSLDDDKLKRVKRKIQDDAIALQRKNKSLKSDEIDANRSLICFTSMSGWSWEKPLLKPATNDKPAIYGEEPSFHGEKPTFNQANVYRVFDELPWFRDQIEEKIGETKSFFQP